ncbi:hypothetical protein CGCSCA5_v011769 [Colletotrichum siamense]|nr:hypothetical protein CGCSCA5_v011769 [Colletotrichum siamense]
MAFSLGPSNGFSEDADDHRNPQMIGTHSLGLNKHYAPSWNQWHAFREFIQNWRDGILVAFDMDPTLFLPIWDETTPGVISTTVHHEIKGRRELVGFIMHREGKGTVEIANFGADLSMDDLSIGGSTKRKCTKLAGAHSEGFKVGALVMVRAGFPIRIRSMCANWNFGFLGSKKDRFYCKISDSGEEHVSAEKRAWREQTSWGTRPRSDSVSYSHKDVTVQLSHSETGRGYRVPITAQEFRGWTTVSLDLNRPDPDKMIRTPHGDLIIDQRFAGQIYLKGLRVGSGSPGTNIYKRGRSAGLWETAIAEDNDNLVQRYVELFREDCVDVISAEKASRTFAQRIWTWLRTSQPGAFYYSEASGSEHGSVHQVDIILNDMKKHSQKLAEGLWQLLAKYDCVRTPQQERALLLSSSRPVENVDGYFGQNMSRVLESVLAMDPALSGIQLQFVQAAHTTIDLHFDANSRVLRINHKWLDFEAVHVKTPCEFFEVAKHHDVGKIFCCDHAVEDLLELAINHMRYYVDLLPSKATELQRQSREYIRQTPRGVQVSTTPKAGELRVHWLRNRYKLVSQTYGETTVCNITLHSVSKCKPRREDLIINMDNEWSERDIYSATPQARHHQPVEESLDRETDAREEAISERVWQNEESPQLRSIFLTPRTLCSCESNGMDMFLESSLYDSRLDIKFEKDRYYEIRDISQCYPNYIAWVHDVHYGSAGCVHESHLSITKFSTFRQEHLFRGGRKANERADIGDLLLHFSSVQHMGDQSDAEVVMIKDIAFAKALSTSFRVKYRPVCHTQSRVPLNVDGSSMTDEGAKEELSCRFARSASDETVTITPIIPKHLSPEERPKPKGFSSHAAVGVFDFTPNVLGPLEGFAEAGFNSFAGVGFDPEHSINWKMRYPNCPVFDGSAQQLFDDFGSGTLHHPELLADNPIKVSLVAGENTDRCLQPRIDPELNESFLTPLNIMDSITQSNFDPDFRVLQMPPGVFHPNICEKFASTICQLLEKGETVRVNISSLQSFGCARQRYLVNTVTSRFPGLAVVPIELTAQRAEDDEFKLITNLIKDLSFNNTRNTGSVDGLEGHFVCSPSGELGSSNASPSYVYNHNTMVRSSKLGGYPWFPSFNLRYLAPEDSSDPEHEPYLTVREIARLQHFKDDFIFYGSTVTQFHDVVAAQPPPVARAIANCIKSVIERSGGKIYWNRPGGD